LRLRILAIGTGMPQWVAEGFATYAQRMRPPLSVELVEIPALARRRGSDLERIRRDEGRRMLASMGDGDRVIALDVLGRSWSTEGLADHLRHWMQEARDTCFLIGGPEGLSEECLARADQRWSLSALTFPHPLVRVILAEQLYRAWTILQGHPYHRSE
jgi:23S rRNA (pseudouridine1915-N3)-methyltransferase